MSGQTVQYTPLLHSTASDDEDDIFESDGDDGKDGQTKTKRLSAIHLNSAKPSAPRDGVAVRNWRRKRRTLIVAVLVACLLVVGGIAAAVFSYLSHEFNTGVVHDESYIAQGDWTLFYNKTASDSGVTLVDVDGDGLEDVLVGISSIRFAENHSPFPGLTVKESCHKLGLQYPCYSQVVALRGYDRHVLWRTWMAYDLVFVNCDDIDVNADGKADCIFSGHYSALQAVDLATGEIHWVMDAEEDGWGSHFVAQWLVGRPLTIPDVDGDGIKDLVVTHGGDPDKAAEDHDRKAGRVIFLSGKSGRPLGRYLSFPNNRETYMSPVRYQTANGSAYILLGSGGETMSGDLMIISYSDLHGYIMGSQAPQLRVLYRGREKGVMVSPVLIDITQDGTLDILMSAFEGVVTLFDGETLHKVWSRQLSGPQMPDFESYSTPAPGRFDDDDVPDFMTMWGKGRWPDYDYAVTYILSGVDGSILWQRQSQMVPYYSPISLRTTGSHDLFIMRVVSLASPTSATSVSNARGTPHKRHIGAHKNETDSQDWDHITSHEGFRKMCKVSRREYLEDHKSCSADLSQQTAQVYVMDRAHRDSPQSVHTTAPQPYHYTLPVKQRGRHCHHLSPADRSLVDVCVILESSGMTGGVSDVDGDGEMDLIQAELVIGQIVRDNYSYDHTYSDFIVSRKSLTSALRDKARLVPMKDQPWRQFMGSQRDGVYRV
ncbi:hypothetical protein ACOMHN_057740 [Nucella lapillus]